LGGWTGSGSGNGNSNSNGNSLNTETTDYTKTTRISPSGGEAGAADGIAFDQKRAWGVSRRPVAHAAQIRVVTV
jgi:hypothetical protein